MPQIPVYDKRVSPTTSPSRVLVDADSFTSSGRQIEAVARTVGNIGEAFEKMQDARDRLDANSQFRMKSAEIRSKIAQDPEAWNNRDKYVGELEKARSESMSKARNNPAKLSLEDDLDAPYLSSLMEINTHARTNLNNTMVTKLQQNVDAASAAYVRSSNPLEIHDAVESIRSNIKASIENGYIDAEKGQVYLQKTLDALPARRVEHAIDTNPEQALKDIQAGTFEGLQHGDKNKYEAMANEAVKRQKKIRDIQFEKVQTENSIEVTKAYLNGYLSKDTLDDLIVKGTISTEFAQAVNDSMNGAASVKPSTKSDIFVDLMHKAFVNGDSERMVIEKAMAAHAKGDLSQDDLGYFLNTTKMMFDSDKQPPQTQQQFDDLKTKTKNALKFVDDWVKNYQSKDKEAQMNIIKDFNKSQGMNTDPVNSLNAAIKNQIRKDHPETMDSPDVPNGVVGANGAVRYVFPRSTNIAPHRIFQQESTNNDKKKKKAKE